MRIQNSVHDDDICKHQHHICQRQSGEPPAAAAATDVGHRTDRRPRQTAAAVRRDNRALRQPHSRHLPVLRTVERGLRGFASGRVSEHLAWSRTIQSRERHIDVDLSRYIQHLRVVAALAPMDIVLLTFTAIAFKAETSAVVGMVCGALFGLAFGIKALIDFMRDYRDIME